MSKLLNPSSGTSTPGSSLMVWMMFFGPHSSSWWAEVIIRKGPFVITTSDLVRSSRKIQFEFLTRDPVLGSTCKVMTLRYKLAPHYMEHWSIGRLNLVKYFQQVLPHLIEAIDHSLLQKDRLNLNGPLTQEPVRASRQSQHSCLTSLLTMFLQM